MSYKIKIEHKTSFQYHALLNMIKKQFKYIFYFMYYLCQIQYINEKPYISTHILKNQTNYYYLTFE